VSVLTSSTIVSTLRAAGCVFAEDEAAMLISSARDDADLASMVERRVSGLPIEHVVGWALFCGLRIEVDPGVFVPRRRTEYLVGEAVALSRAGSVVVDVCCGSGALGVAVAAARPVELYSADVDPAAVRCARRNVEPIGGQVFEGDLFSALPDSLRGRVDVLLANVPYVPSDEVRLLPTEARVHEPLVTLDGGRDGLEVLRRVSAEAFRWLAPGGSMLVETTEEQAPIAASVFTHDGLAARISTSEGLDAAIVIGTRE
jgi:release factor glutamine methyltransferase